MFTEDLAPFFSTTEFGTAATLGAVAVSGILDKPYALGDVGFVGLAGNQPVFILPTASVSADPVGTTLTVGAASFIVVAHEPDGTGVSRLVLEVAA
jgi:hypothetical protein